MLVICLFHMLIYSPTKSLIFFPNRAIQVICNIYRRKTKYRNVSFFQYRAALLQYVPEAT